MFITNFDRGGFVQMNESQQKVYDALTTGEGLTGEFTLNEFDMVAHETCICRVAAEVLFDYRLCSSMQLATALDLDRKVALELVAPCSSVVRTHLGLAPFGVWDDDDAISLRGPGGAAKAAVALARACEMSAKLTSKQ
jgi:hypothetical protein